MNEIICSFKLYEAEHKRFKSRTEVTIQEIINLRDELIGEAKTIDALLSKPQSGSICYLKRLPKTLASKWGFTIYPIVGITRIVGVDESVRLAINNKLKDEILNVGYCDDLNNYLRTSVKDEYKKHLTGDSELLKNYSRAIVVCDSIILLLES